MKFVALPRFFDMLLRINYYSKRTKYIVNEIYNFVYTRRKAAIYLTRAVA